MAGLPRASPAVTVMVSTYVPSTNPVTVLLHQMTPLPAPLAVSTVSHWALLGIAVQMVVSAPVPVKVTVTESICGASAPTIAVSAQLDGLIVSTSGSRIISVSMICAGLPCAPLAVTVIVST